MTKSDFSAGSSTLHARFAAVAKQHADRPALVQGERSFTFGELDAASSRLARRLRALGVRPERYVGVSAVRSVDTLVAILAVAKAGGAYVPIDPELPEARRRGMVARCGIDVLLHVGPPPRLAAKEIAVDGAVEDAPAFVDDAAPDHPLVVLHTSGTTGEPKAVVLTHRGIVAYLDQLAASWGVTADDRLVQFATLSFDVSVEEIGLSWCTGARLMLRTDDMLAPDALLEAARTHGLSIVEVPTSYLPLLTAAAKRRGGWPTSLRVVCVGGERLQPAWLASYLEDPAAPRLVSMYGPTEASISVTACEGRDVRSDAPLGAAVPGCEVYVLDDAMRPAASGEIYIGGACLARGYLGAPGATADRFVPSPFARGERLYRTGDLARRNADGLLDYVGRADDQVKVRGFRVELGEVETALMQVEGVREAVAVARDDAHGVKQIIGYVVGDADAETVRRSLRTKLPAYALPASVMRLPAMPLTDRGKVDRRALPAPTFMSTSEYVAPRTETEAIIAAVVAECLKLERVGIDDDFFALGGDSLTATEATRRLSERFGRELPIRLLFAFPTPRRLADHLETDRARMSGPGAVSATKVPDDAVTSFEEAYLLGWEAHRPRSPVWNHGEAIEILGPLDEARLAEAFRRTLERQSALRRAFVAPDAKAKVRLVAASEVPWQTLDATRATDEEATKLAADFTNQAFAFDGSPLVRALLLRRGAERHVLAVAWHIAVHDHDGPASSLLSSEILATYDGVDLPPLGIRYADYAKWSHDWFDGDGAKDLDALRRRFADVRPLELADGVVEGPRRFDLEGHRFFLDPDASARFNETLRAASATRFMGTLAAVGVLMRRIRNAETVPLMSLRNFKSRRPELEPLAGRFTGPVPIAMHVEAGATWAEHLAKAKAAALEAFNERGPTPVTRVFGTDIPVDHPLGALTLNEMGADTRLPDFAVQGSLRWRSSQLPMYMGARATMQIACSAPGEDGRLSFVVGGARDRFAEGTIASITRSLEEIVRSIDLGARPIPRAATPTRAPWPPVEPPETTVQFRDPRGAPAGDGLVAVGLDFEPGTILHGYRQGIFPWPIVDKEQVDGAAAVRWCSPEPRCLMRLSKDVAPRWSESLRKTLKKHRFEITMDEDFEGVVRMCGETRRDLGTWLLPPLVAGYRALHRLGWAHSVEVWEKNEQGRELVGGLFGMAVGASFAADSMFHKRPDTSKIAFAYLVEKLRAAGFVFIDVQAPSPHLKSLGNVEVPREEFLEMLDTAVRMTPERLV